MKFKEYYHLDENLKSKLKALGLAGVAALSNPADAGDMTVSFRNIVPPSSSGVSSTNTDSFMAKAASFIEKNEGKVNRLYRDSSGKWHIGIGHLVLPEEMNLFKGKVLSDKEIMDIFKKDLNQKVLSVKRRFGDVFDSYSDDLKIAILDGYFRGDLPGSPKTIKLLKEKKFKQAAQEYLDNAEYRASKEKGTGVYKRMERNAAIMSKEAVK